MDHAPVVAPTTLVERCPFEWLARVLVNFAVAEQALGLMCMELGLPIAQGPLSSLNEARRRLIASGEKRLRLLDVRIERWRSYRSMRHLLAHSTLHCLIGADGSEIVVTRCLPLDRNDVTPDRMWTPEEREELLRQATNDGRSIADQVRNLLADPKLLKLLRESQVQVAT